MIPGEDDATNPGIYGKALALWLADQLRATGSPTGDVIAEDFGWCIPVESAPHHLYVACASSGEEPNNWQVFAFAEGGIASRLFGQDESETSLTSLFTAVRHCLESHPSIRGLSESPLDA